jgi:hypothetical protein
MKRSILKQALFGMVAFGLAMVWSAPFANADVPRVVGLETQTKKPILLPLKVQAAYNSDTMFFNIQWEGDQGDTHDLVQYKNGAWQKGGGPRRDAQATIDEDPLRGWSPASALDSTNYESRVTWMINDPDPAAANHVPGFSQTGCFMTCHDDSRAMPEWDPNENKTKYLNEGTEGSLDLWHHRQARANPIGASDDQFVTQVGSDPTQGGRFGDAGDSPWEVNKIVDGHPTWVLDPAEAGGDYAFKFENTHESPNRFFRAPGTAELGADSVPQSMDWTAAETAGYVPTEGDTLPRRRLRTPTDSRGDISGLGTTFTPNIPNDDHSVGTIESNTQRLLNTHNADDTNLADLADDEKLFDIAFAVHTGMITVRDHYIGFAMTLGNQVSDADIQAMFFEGSGNETLPDWSQAEVAEFDLFLPGITSLEFLLDENKDKVYQRYENPRVVDQVHGGAGGVASGTSCTQCHSASGDGAGGVGMSMATLVPDRGGVWTQTPLRVPEPATLVLLTLTGVIGLAVAARRRKRK